jgi:hypothetical protein
VSISNKSRLAQWIGAVQANRIFWGRKDSTNINKGQAEETLHSIGRDFMMGSAQAIELGSSSAESLLRQQVGSVLNGRPGSSLLGNQQAVASMRRPGHPPTTKCSPSASSLAARGSKNI